MKHVPARLTAIPAAPFLVPVVMEALRKSRFSSVTTTVACEAEVACVNDREPKDIILTSDSDLIVLTPVGRVMFFNDLSFGTIEALDDTLEGVYYSRLDLASKLNCGDLLKLAFYMTRDPHLGIKECAKQASQLGFRSENVAQKYAQFKETYATAVQYSAFACVTEVKNPYPALQSTLEILDGRVSEFVQQWLSGLNTAEFSISGATSHYVSSQATRTMFLSLLIDDPTRASAWRVGSDIRCLAYSILALYGPSWKMIEYDRRGERMTGVEVALMEQPQSLESTCNVLTKDISYVISQDDDTASVNEATSHDKWKLYLLTSMLRSAVAATTAIPDSESILHFLTAPSASYSWPHIHLSAQVEGHLYSHRILQQVLAVYLCGDIPPHPQVDVQVLQKLYNALKALPAPQTIFTRAGGGFKLESDDSTMRLNTILDEIYGKNDSSALTKQHEEPGNEGFERQRSKKRKKGRADGSAVSATDRTGNQSNGASTTHNMFALLGDDW